ncbi:MAG: diaminopimelate decarboxylase [Armatimonadota bacterium]|nr:diaminopimelate decarboxylase [Armatimonadota bacterium]
MLLGTQRVNERNHLEIGGCDAVELAAEFGTPLYVVDEALIRQNCLAYKQAFQREYGDSAVAYAGKAFIVRAVCALMAKLDMWLDVASAGELYTALKGNFPPQRMLFHGNYKTQQELQMAVDHGVGYVVVDSFVELDQLSATAQAAGRVQPILIRCNPGVDPHTHRLISTGKEDSKFGFNIKDGSAMAAVKRALELPGVDLQGIHCHIGSQLLDLTPYTEAAPVMTSFLKQIRDETGVELPVLDMGGGLGIRYLEEHHPPTIDELAKSLSAALLDGIAKAGLTKPRLFVEPGRSIVGEAGTTLYTVGPVKEVSIPEPPGKRVYVSVDGGLSDNPRPALYDALYSALVANKAGDEPKFDYTVSGRHCETDMLIPHIKLPRVETGDILAVQSTGAYNYSMASNYNRFTRPAVVFVYDGKADLVVRRETLDDLLKCDLLPDRLA